jgi:hypothetical protein
MNLTRPAILLLLTASPLFAQEFKPPKEEDTEPTSIKVGLTGFSSRVGVDFKGTTQLISSIAFDVADLYSSRVRVRPSGEIGVGGGTDTYVGSLDVMYRFTMDSERAVPYIGFGLGFWSHAGCAAATDCPSLWPQFTLGFELNFRPGINWLLEYRGEDTLRRHRFFIGLATRRGG